MAHQILRMYNAEIEGVGDCTQESFDQIYQFRGWQLVGPLENYATGVLEVPVGDIEKVTNDDLRRLVASTGQPVPPADTKKEELITQLKSGVPGGELPVHVVAVVDDAGIETDPAGQPLPDPVATPPVKTTPSGGKSAKNS